jgi:hypothetical protein
MIEVKPIEAAGSLEFEATVRDAKGETRHLVTMSRETYENLTGGRSSPEQCVKAAFEFLLAHEPKESILRRFDLTVISHYFPDFEREFPRYLQRVS